MKVHSSAFALMILCAIAMAAQSKKGTALSWNDSTRDVYVDNQQDHAAQVLVCDSPQRLALISPLLDRAVVLDVQERTVSAASKDTFNFAPDRTTATSAGGAPFEFDKAMGTLVPATVDFVGDENIKTKPGEFPTRHFKMRLEQGACYYWLHTQLGIPLRAQATNGHEYVLTSFSLASAGK